MVGKASEEVAGVCYSHRDHEAGQAREEARRKARREREERRRREETARGAERHAREKDRELIRA